MFPKIIAIYITCFLLIAFATTAGLSNAAELPDAAKITKFPDPSKKERVPPPLDLELAQKLQMEQCKQIVVAGDPDWAPYTIKTETGVTGVGIDLVKQIFAQLDIPVKELEFSDKRSIYYGLQLGDIDILVSLYPDGELESFLDILEPGYSADPITVLVRKGKSAGMNRWDDLIGLTGITTKYFPLELSFAEYASGYLYINQESDLIANLALIKNRKVDYLLGSKMQLEYALIGQNKDDFELASKILAPTEVHMGFSKRSPCKAYFPFLRKNLLEMKDAGDVAAKIAEYSAKAAAAEKTAAEAAANTSAEPKKDASEFDYLLGH